MAIINIRKPRTDRSGWKNFAAPLPRKLGAYLSLYALTRNKNKSEVMREQMQQWYQDHHKLCTEEELLQDLTSRIRTLWFGYRSTHPDIHYEEFREQLTDDLRHKGIDEVHIQKILQCIDETH